MALRPALPVLPALAALALCSAPRPAAAQDALALFGQGRALVEKGNHAAACPLFAEAHRLQPTAIGIVINLADCYNNIGKTASAWSAYREGEFLAKKAGENDRAQYSHDHAAAIEPRLSHLKIVAEATPGLIVHRDDQEVGKGILGTSFPVDPGPHKIEATAPGYLVWSTSITVGPERDEPVVAIPALGRAPGGSEGGGGSGGPFVWTGQRIAGLGVALAGVAGLAAGGVLGGMAISKNSASKADCAPGQPNLCLSSDVSARQSAGTLADASTGVLIGGGVAAVAGVIVLLTGAPKRGPASTGRIELAPVVGSKTAGLGLRGAW
jgi:hypothetical protein